MTNKSMVLLAAATTIASLSMAISGTVHADDQQPAGATSQATVNVTAGGDSGPTDPIPDPDHPGTGNEGPLTLDYASSFEFNDTKITSGTVEATPKSDGAGLDSNLYGAQVTDVRGTGAGWNLTVQLDKLSEDGGHELKGATLSLPAGNVTTNNEDSSNAATSTAVTLGTDNTAQTILTASQDQGMGTWFSEMNGDNVKLSIPGGQYSGNYTSTLTWSLTDAPM